jgi:hypothetical protein
LNNIKNISLAIHNFADRKKSFPFASTAFFMGRQAPNTGVPKAGGQRDGYSWLFQILPEMENVNLYNRTRDSTSIMSSATASTSNNVGSNKLIIGPFGGDGANDEIAILTGTFPSGQNGAAYQQQIEVFQCPSFPGSNEAKGTFATGLTKVAVGNYVAIPSTHYNTDGLTGGGNTAASDTGSVAGSLYDSQTSATAFKQLAGNGCIVFANNTVNDTNVNGGAAVSIYAIQRKPTGVTFAGVRDGTANTILFAESKEDAYSSWISGLASFVVAVDPANGGEKIQKVQSGTTTPAMLGWPISTNGKLALNVGNDVKRLGGINGSGPPAVADNQNNIYQKPWIHQPAGGNTQARVFGPSSGHPGAVQHAYADAHGKTINDDVDPNVYVRLVTRAGNEVVELP